MQTALSPASYAIFKSFLDLVPLRDRFTMKLNSQDSSTCMGLFQGPGKAPSALCSQSAVKLINVKLIKLNLKKNQNCRLMLPIVRLVLMSNDTGMTAEMWRMQLKKQTEHLVCAWWGTFLMFTVTNMHAYFHPSWIGMIFRSTSATRCTNSLSVLTRTTRLGDL